MLTSEARRRLEAAEKIVRKAGAFALERFANREKLEISVKGAQDWVTDVDKSVEQLVVAELRAAFPADAIIGEEGAAEGGPDSDVKWFIDPIDGTTCFMLGIAQWCVVLACTHRGVPVVAAMYDPVADELYSAARGAGAHCNGERLSVSNAPGLDQGFVSVGCHKSARPDRSLAIMGELIRQDGMYLRIGSCALALAYAAAGRLLAVFEPNVAPWDCLAGMLLVEEAGGRVSDYDPVSDPGRRSQMLASSHNVWPQFTALVDLADRRTA